MRRTRDSGSAGIRRQGDLAKILLIAIVFAAAYFLLRAYARSFAARPPQGPPASGEDMVRCRHCGLHLPRGESVKAGGEFFCSEEHRKLHGS